MIFHRSVFTKIIDRVSIIIDYGAQLYETSRQPATPQPIITTQQTEM